MIFEKKIYIIVTKVKYPHIKHNIEEILTKSLGRLKKHSH